MKNILTSVVVLFLTIVSANTLAQNPIILERYVCPSASKSVLEFNDIKAEKSDDFCHELGAETVLQYDVSGDTDMAKVSIQRVGNGPYTARLNIDWLNDAPGILTIEVYYRRFIAKYQFPIGVKCDLTGQRYLYTYKIYRLGVNPGGTFAGDKILTAPTDQTVSVFNFKYKPSSTYPESLTAKKISYQKNESEWVTEDLIKGADGEYVETPVIYNATGLGNFQLNAKVLDDCDVWHPLPVTTLSVYPSCYQDDASQVKASIAELEHLEFPLSSKVEVNTPYSIHLTGITDFSEHYTWNTEDGGDHLMFEGNSFVLKKGPGSYRIIANKKPGRELCPSIPAIPIFSGGNDVTIAQDCGVIIPDIFQDLSFLEEHGLKMIEPTDILFKHFAVTIVSKTSIIVKPGVTLALGAEMILDLPPPLPEPRDPDLDMNFVEQSAYDEYGRVLLSDRSYFDDRGMGIQNQYKVLSSNVTMANATIYDTYGRPVISTLAAPTGAAIKMAPDACGIQRGDQTIKFRFKEDFVKTESGVYSYKNFDIISEAETKEENPDPLDTSVPGTLGWYYSENNGNASGKEDAMNEPLTAATSFPYARTLYHHDGSGEVKGVTRPGDAFRAGTGKIVTTQKEIVSASDEYLDAYLDMRMELGFNKPTGEMLEGNFFRTVVTDENNKRSITYTDKSGGSIISLYFGEETVPITTSYQFFDNAGRLLASVSPNGVERYDGTNFNDIDKTTYEYNFKGWLLKLTEPDAGTTQYLYRRDGKIRFSQNDEQMDEGSFSYTNYDKSGRPVESGEFHGGLKFESGLNDMLETLGYEGGLSDGKRSSWIRTYYDQPAEALAVDFDSESLDLPLSRTQRFLLGAVSCSQNQNTTTWYSYDERGRVEWMVQRINNAPSEAFSIKTIDYRYGPAGSVQEVLYQKDQPDQFTHYYEYDSDGRLVKVYITTDKLEYNKLGELTNPTILSLQATYYYYLHGPLKRIELENRLQGIDYVYTADGALKAINHHDPEKDPAGDGIANDDFKKDVFGMTLDYYAQDYASAHYDATALELSDYEEFYSGIIKAVRWHGPVEPGKSHAYAFRYDERYQLLDANWADVDGSSLTFSGEAYRETIGGYDKNGNIASLYRMNNLGNSIADFDLYEVERYGNRLKRIVSNDKEVRSYDYDDIGRMTYEQNSDGERFVDYEVSGKVIGVYRQQEADGTFKSPMVTFGYDDRGFRLFKTAFNDKGAKTKTTWYVRDASGNIVGTYEEDHEVTGAPLLAEVPVYGSGRIGMYKPAYGQTLYEITDHLGNVRAVIGGSVQTTMLATMEQERQEKESQDFFGMRTTVSATDINHTTAMVTVDGETDIVEPNEVIRLNNRPNGRYSPNPIGGGTMLWVHPGDTIRAEVFAKYARLEQTQNKSQLIAMAAMMKNLSPIDNAVEMRKAFQMLGSSNFRSLPAWGKLDDAQPPAFLNGLLFDKDMKLQRFDFDQVSEKASMKAVDQADHEKLELEFVAEKEGYLYIYISNESKENLDVYFDDLRVTHVYGTVVAGGDYYPYGLPIEDRQITLEKYRFGYQGQFAEKDEETNWNHFELREYDPEIARWLVPDPMREHWSPYIAMGNNPINIVDPDGGCEKCPKDGTGEITQILGKDYIWDGTNWLPISQEVVIEANRPTMNELFDRFAPAQPDAVTYIINLPMGRLFQDYSKGLYVYSSQGGGGGSGSKTRDPNQDPAAEGIDLAWLLQFNNGRGEDEHGIIQREHDKHGAPHNPPPVPVDTLVEKDWGFTDYPNDSSGRVIWEKYYRVIDSNGDTSHVQMETHYNSPLKRPK